MGGDDTARTTFEIDVLPAEAGNCDLILQDLCFWHSVSYRIKENSLPTVIGSLASPYLLQTCRGYEVNYTLINGESSNCATSKLPYTDSILENDDIELIPPDAPSGPWNIKSTRTFDRDTGGNGTGHDLINAIVECKLRTPQGEVKTVSKGFTVYVLDIDDNPPESQEPELIIHLNSNVVMRVSFVKFCVKLMEGISATWSSDKMTLTQKGLSIKVSLLSRVRPYLAFVEMKTAGFICLAKITHSSLLKNLKCTYVICIVNTNCLFHYFPQYFSASRKMQRSQKMRTSFHQTQKALH